MRRTAFFLAATVGASLTVVAPAQAGTGASHYCFDGGWTDISILPGPITVGIEIETTPTNTAVVVCYATSSVGYADGHLTGGFVKVLLYPDGSGQVQCQSDQNEALIDLDCSVPFEFRPTTGGFEVTVQGTVTGEVGPIDVGKTGVEMAPFITISPGVAVNPSYPCIYVLGSPLLPCGHPII